MTITDHIRKRLLECVGVIDVKMTTKLSPQEIVDSEMDWEFLTEMSHGMLMGYFRYGKASDSKINNLKEVYNRLKLYEETKNQEYLRDAANFIMQERRRPSLSGVYFKTIDDGHHANLERINVNDQ